MNIPDPAIWAGIPTMAVFAGWTAKMFVDSRQRRNADPGDMKVRDALVIAANITPHIIDPLADAMVKKLNGRYMLEKDATRRFDEVIAGQQHSLHEIRTIIGRPLVMLLEEKHPAMAQQLQRDLQDTKLPD